VLCRNSSCPLYLQVAQDLQTRIESGEFASSSMLPSEQDLCVTYCVSRTTVRRALSLMEEYNVISPHQGKGIYLQEPKLPDSLAFPQGFTQYCIEHDIPIATQILVLCRSIPTPYVARRLQLAQGDAAVFLKRLRTLKNVPVALEQTWLPFERFSFLLNTGLEIDSLYEMIEQHTDIHIRGNISPSIVLKSELALADDAELLQLAMPAAVFVADEIVNSTTGSPILFTRRILRGDCSKYYFSNRANQLSILAELVQDKN